MAIKEKTMPIRIKQSLVERVKVYAESEGTSNQNIHENALTMFLDGATPGMVYKKGDRVKKGDRTYTCICADVDVAVFGLPKLKKDLLDAADLFYTLNSKSMADGSLKKVK